MASGISIPLMLLKKYISFISTAFLLAKLKWVSVLMQSFHSREREYKAISSPGGNLVVVFSECFLWIPSHERCHRGNLDSFAERRSYVLYRVPHSFLMIKLGLWFWSLGKNHRSSVILLSYEGYAINTIITTDFNLGHLALGNVFRLFHCKVTLFPLPTTYSLLGRHCTQSTFTQWRVTLHLPEGGGIYILYLEFDHTGGFFYSSTF